MVLLSCIVLVSDFMLRYSLGCQYLGVFKAFGPESDGVSIDYDAVLMG